MAPVIPTAADAILFNLFLEITEIAIREIVPEIVDSLLTALLLKEFEQFAIGGYKFCARYHIVLL
jgi:hypothetical protein